jgi:hypothetical protein
MIPNLKGIIWLLLASVIQIPQLVRSSVFLESIVVSHRRFAGAHIFELKWYVFVIFPTHR